MCMGMLLGYFTSSLTVILVDKGASFKDLGNISWIALPFSFKFVIAPYIDSLYIKKIGKRKTYICSSLLLMGVIMIFYS